MTHLKKHTKVNSLPKEAQQNLHITRMQTVLFTFILITVISLFKCFYLNGLVQKRHNSIANELELHLFSIKSWKWFVIFDNGGQGLFTLHSQYNYCRWAPYQIRKIAGYACAGNAGNVFPATTG